MPAAIAVILRKTHSLSSLLTLLHSIVALLDPKSTSHHEFANLACSLLIASCSTYATSESRAKNASDPMTTHNVVYAVFIVKTSLAGGYQVQTNWLSLSF